MGDFKTAEVAELLGYSTDTLRVLRRRYSVGHKVGGQWRYTLADIEEIKRHSGKVGKKNHLLDTSSSV